MERGKTPWGSRASSPGHKSSVEVYSVRIRGHSVSRLHCEHQETMYKLRSRVRHLTDDLPRLEKRLEDVQRDLTTRQDTSGDKFVVTVEGQEIRDRGIAGELLLRRAERMRGTRKEWPVGSIAGFQVFVADNFMQGPEIVLKGATTYTAKVTDTAHGTIRSVEYVIQHLEEVAETLTRNISDTRKRLTDTQAQVDTPFEYGERLAELSRRQQQIEDDLDLTKNQASAQIEAAAAPDSPTTASEADSANET